MNPVSEVSGGYPDLFEQLQWLEDLLMREDPRYELEAGKAGGLFFLDNHILHLNRSQNRLKEFLICTRLIETTKPCVKCNQPMTIEQITDKDSSDQYRYKCDKSLPNGQNCTGQKSFRDGSWFTCSKLSIPTVLRLTYFILQWTPSKKIERYLKIPSKTVAVWVQYVEECLVESFINNSQPIGGKGIIVEIDPSKFGKRMYNRGHAIEGQWVLGGIERGGDGRVFLVPLPGNKRSAGVLKSTVHKYVLPGTIIVTDCWNGYNSLGITSYEHLTVNDSKNFVDPNTGAHIKGLWRYVKEKVTGHNRQPRYFNNRLGRFLFLRQHSRKGTDEFLHFLDIIRRIHWTPEGTIPLTTDDLEDDSLEPYSPDLLDCHR